MRLQEQKTFEVMQARPDDIRRLYESSRIEIDDSFTDLYSSVREDSALVEKTLRQHEGQTTLEIGRLAETLVYEVIHRGAFGNEVTVRAPSDYDDIFHGADLLIESTSTELRDPMVSSIDVTISQRPIRDTEHQNQEVAIDRKLKRIKSFIDGISEMGRKEAIDLHAWIMSGGLSQQKTPENKELFLRAEKVMTLKYYKNPKTSVDPEKPRFVLAGPQVALSLDRSFVNKVTSSSNNKESMQDISALVQTEVPFVTASILKYIIDKAKSLKDDGRETNLFFDMLQSSYQSWGLTYNSEIPQMKITRALQRCLSDEGLRAQLGEYRDVVNKVFNLKY